MIRDEQNERLVMKVEVEERVARWFRNVGSRPPYYAMSYPRRPQSGSFLSYVTVSFVCAENRLLCVFIAVSKLNSGILKIVALTLKILN